VDPVNAGTLYAGTWTDGVLKSSDDGVSWEPANHGLHGQSFVGALAKDPLSPSILYLWDGLGFFATHDGGAHWLRPGAPLANVVSLAVAPGVAGTVYGFVAGIGSGEIEKSLDGGATWNPVLKLASLGGPSPAIYVAPSTPDTVYVAYSQWRGSPLRFRMDYAVSRDGGKSFQFLFSFPTGLGAFAVDPTDANTFYLANAYGSVYPGALFKSTDGGRTLVQLPVSSGISALLIDPANPSTVYAGIYQDVMVSRDGGMTWSELAPGLSRVSISQLAFGPGGALYAVTQTTVFRLAL